MNIKGVEKMGYIAPVHNFPYNDYQLRAINNKRNHYFINKPFKSVLESPYQDIKNHPEERQKITMDKQHSPLMTKSSEMVEEYEVLTGKGSHFSVSV